MLAKGVYADATGNATLRGELGGSQWAKIVDAKGKGRSANGRNREEAAMRRGRMQELRNPVLFEGQREGRQGDERGSSPDLWVGVQ